MAFAELCRKSNSLSEPRATQVSLGRGMRKVSTTCPSLNVMDLLKCLFIVSNNTSTNLMSKLPCLRLWTDASRRNMKQSNKDLKTETKHQRWSSWISTSGVVSTAATAAARVRAWSSAFAAPRIVTRQCAAFSFHFHPFSIQNLWILGDFTWLCYDLVLRTVQ